MDAYGGSRGFSPMIPPIEGSSRECDMRAGKGPKKIFVPFGKVVSQAKEERSHTRFLGSFGRSERTAFL